jgi:hypothetical protein
LDGGRAVVSAERQVSSVYPPPVILLVKRVLLSVAEKYLHIL